MIDLKKSGNQMVKKRHTTFFKKGVSAYVSWILIMAFVVVLSAFMYSFMVSYTEDTTDDVKKQVYNTDECRSVSVNIVTGCLSSQTLNITVQNTDYIRIDGMDFRVYDLSKRPLHTNRTNITMNPNRIKQIEIDTGATNVGFVEIIPIVYKDDLEILCSEKKAQADIVACT